MWQILGHRKSCQGYVRGEWNLWWVPHYPACDELRGCQHIWRLVIMCCGLTARVSVALKWNSFVSQVKGIIILLLPVLISKRHILIPEIKPIEINTFIPHGTCILFYVYWKAYFILLIVYQFIYQLCFSLTRYTWYPRLDIGTGNYRTAGIYRIEAC